MEKRNRSNEGTGKKRGRGNAKNAAGGVGELLETLKKHKVLTYKADGVELTISPLAYVEDLNIGGLGMDANQVNKQIDESDLFYSARN